MVLDYAPCDVLHLSDLFKICYNMTDTNNYYEQENILLEFLDNRFCKHIYEKGKNKGKICLTKHKNTGFYCNLHTDKPKKVINKCKGNTIRGKPCGRNVKENHPFCIYCIKKNIKNNTFSYKCRIYYKNLYFIDKPIHYTSCLIPFSNYIPFHILLIQFVYKYNISIDLLFFILNMFSEIFKILKIHLTYNENNAILYQHKKNYLNILFNDKIYTYIDKYNYNKFMKILKKIYTSNLYNNIHYKDIKKINPINPIYVKDIINIEKNFIKQYLYDKSIEYVIDVIRIEDSFHENIKPDVNIESFFGKVGYIDKKVKVFKFPIKDNNIYSDIFDKYILYYKHVANGNISGMKKEPYLAYVLCIENSKPKYETISFIDIFKILNKIYNKNSIINHIKEITYNKLDISKLLN